LTGLGAADSLETLIHDLRQEGWPELATATMWPSRSASRDWSS